MADEDWAAEVDEQERQITGQVSESWNREMCEKLLALLRLTWKKAFTVSCKGAFFAAWFFYILLSGHVVKIS